MRKFITSITLTLILLSLTIFTGYAVFKFPGIFSPVVQGDPIKENWDPVKSDFNISNQFEVTFFPQPRYAYAGDLTVFNDPSKLANIDLNMILNYKNDDRVVNASNHMVNTLVPEGNNSTQVNSYGRYGGYDGYFSALYATYDTKFDPITIKAESVITKKDFEKYVGFPICDKKSEFTIPENGNSVNKSFDFIGWSYSQERAMDSGYGAMYGDFSLITTKISLDAIDRMGFDGKYYSEDKIAQIDNRKIKGIDGTYVGDGKVFLYAMYGCGFTDSSHTYYVDESSVSLKYNLGDNSRLIPFNLVEKQNIGLLLGEPRPSKHFINTYQLKGLEVTQDDIDKGFSANLMVRPYIDQGGGQYYNHTLDNLYIKEYNTYTYSTDNLEKSFANLNLIKKPGHYNIYYSEIPYHVNYPYESAEPSFDYRYRNPILNGKNLTDSYYYIDNGSITGSSYVGFANIRVWIYIEEVPELQFVGGTTHSLKDNQYTERFCFNPFNNKTYEFRLKNIKFYDNELICDYPSVSSGYMKNGVFSVIPFFKDVNNKHNSINCTISPSGQNVTNALFDTDYNMIEIKDRMIKSTVEGTYDIKIDISLTPNGNTINISLERPQHYIGLMIFNTKEEIILDSNGFVDFTKCKPDYVSSREYEYIFEEQWNSTTYVGYLTSNSPLNQYTSVVDLNSKKVNKNDGSGKYKDYYTKKCYISDILTTGKKLYYYNTDKLVDINNYTYLTENTILYLK